MQVVPLPGLTDRHHARRSLLPKAVLTTGLLLISRGSGGGCAIILFPRHDGPGDPGHLVGDRDGDQPGGFAIQQPVCRDGTGDAGANAGARLTAAHGRRVVRAETGTVP